MIERMPTIAKMHFLHERIGCFLNHTSLIDGPSLLEDIECMGHDNVHKQEIDIRNLTSFVIIVRV